MKRPSSLSAATALASTVAVVTLALVAAGVAFAWEARDLPLDDVLAGSPKWFTVQNALSACAFLVPGWYMTVKAPGVVFGWLLLLGALGHAVGGAGWGYVIVSEVGNANLPAPWLAVALSYPGTGVEVPIIAAVMTFYPDGRRPAGWVGLLGVACVLLGVAGTLTAPFQPLDDLSSDPGSRLAELRNPIGIPWLSDATLGGVLFMAPAGIGPVAVILVRWLRASGELRRLLSWLVLGTLAGALLAPLALFGSEWDMLSVQLPTILILAALVAGSLRHRVYGIEVVVSRAFLYASLAAVVAAVYGAIIGVTTLMAGTTTGPASFMAAVAAALALAPARGRVERAVNRVLFGLRDDPYRVLSQVGSRLESSGAADSLLADFTSQVGRALRVPYVAVEYGDAPGTRSVVFGAEPAATESFPLVHRGVATGRLVAGLRTGERAFSAQDRGLLENLARQASAAVANLMLAEDLQRSRERIVSAREEERRRLRRDLHDGLGPVLTGAAMMIDAARNLGRHDTDAADRQLVEARAQVRAAIDDVRRLVYGLRPPALDDLGLLGALQEQARQSAVTVTINAPGTLSDLPAAVEVAAFRIVSEAITNASRHGSATECTVGITLNGALEIQVSDNGSSAVPWKPGVGIVAMRERATELGGVCEAGPGPDGGGLVRAVLPVGGDR